MIAILRVIGGVVAALATAFTLLIAVEGYSSIVHPFPADFQGTQEEVCSHVERYPEWVLATVVPMWGFTAFASVWVAGFVGNRWGALFVGALLFAGAILNLAMLPYPLWFKIVIPIALLIAVAIGFLASSRRMPATARSSGPMDESIDGG